MPISLPQLRYAPLILIGVLIFAFPGPADAQTRKKKARSQSVAHLNAIDPPCRKRLSLCPDGGCSKRDDHDPNLNQAKNIFAMPPGTPEDVELKWFKGLADPQNFQEKGPRDELQAIGEGRYVRTTGHLLIIRKEPGGESCNCGLHGERDTDNHLVLITDETLAANLFHGTATKAELKAMLAAREPESVTVEFTPRWRKHGHPKFLAGNIQPLINRTVQGALLVRITGLTMFDSEHFLNNHLVRHNNWEIHPVLKFEYCPTTKTCTPTGSTNWVDLDK